MIKLKDIVSDTYSNASGYSFYITLRPIFENDNQTNISLEGVSAFSTSFLNSSFGQLIDEYGLDKFKKTLKISNLTKVNGDMIRNYVNSFSSLAH